MAKRRYKVDLQRHMSECDMNYHRLLRLLPELEEREHWAFAVAMPGFQHASIHIKVVERSVYTTTLDFKRDTGVAWLQAKDLVVRLYHDAASAEVVACRRGRQLESRYSYPNQAMYQEDEKTQLNRFLGEWLCYCLENGHSLTETAFA
jgi:hypothetical protein